MPEMLLQTAKDFTAWALRVYVRDDWTDHEKDVKYARIMTVMEGMFGISQIGKNERVPWEIMRAYRKISAMRRTL